MLRQTRKKKWLPNFKMRRNEHREYINLRLCSVKGVTNGLGPHPSDPEIYKWNDRRQRAIGRARRLRTTKHDLPDPSVPSCVVKTRATFPVDGRFLARPCSSQGIVRPNSHGSSVRSTSQGSCTRLGRGRLPSHSMSIPRLRCILVDGSEHESPAHSL